MSSTTTNYGFPFPDESDPPDGATQIENLANALDTQLAVTDGNVATNAGRSVLLATLLGTAVAHYTAFTAAQTVTAIASTTYTAVLSSTTSCGHSFVAPPSGIVAIHWGANAFSGVTGSSLLIGTAVKTGSTVGAGTVVSDVSDDEALVFSLLGDAPGSRIRVVTGLTPGSAYNVRQSARNSGTTSSHIDRPWVVTAPVLA